MAEVTNYWPDPSFRTSTRDGIVAFNIFPNPTPTVDLTHWEAAAGGSITRTAEAALFPENSYGCRVVNGVTLTGANTAAGSIDFNFTGKIKAHQAMTITMTGAMATAGQTFAIRRAGWGSFGWGEELSYTSGVSKTFAAGEECLFRIYCGESSNIAGPVHQIKLTLSGTGTFDLDGITQTAGVDDGFGDDPPYNSGIPNAPLYFSGDTPDDDNFTYSWYGTPHNSPSLQKAKIPTYAGNTPYDYIWNDEMPVIPDGAFSFEAPDGEHRVAQRSAIMNGRNNLVLSDGTNPDIRGLNLEPGNYVVSFDYVQDYTQYFYGYEEPDWGSNCYFMIYDRDPALPAGNAQRKQYMPLNGFTPYRKRFYAPFPVTATSRIEIQWDAPQNWNTSDLYITNIAIHKIESIYRRLDGLPLQASGNYDLMALGVVAGKSYQINVEYYDPAVGTVEYQVGAGAWTTLASSYIGPQVEPDYALGDYYSFTVPADATGVRLRLADPAITIGTFDLFDAPPAFFDGDTPDGGGYSYSWTGTPYQSASIRSDAAAAAITAQIFVGGTAKTVSEMRIVSGGSLVPVTEAG